MLPEEERRAWDTRMEVVNLLKSTFANYLFIFLMEKKKETFSTIKVKMLWNVLVPFH